jgi:hypothetical protein
MSMSGLKVEPMSLLLAHIVDNTATNVWMKTKDAQHHRNRPKSMVDAFTEKKEDNYQTFGSGEEFMKKWEELNG